MKKAILLIAPPAATVEIVCILKLSPPLYMNFTFEYGGRELFEINRFDRGGVVPMILPPPLKTLTTGSAVADPAATEIYRSSNIQFCPSGIRKRVTVCNSGESVIFTLLIVPTAAAAAIAAVLIRITLSGALVAILDTNPFWYS